MDKTYRYALSREGLRLLEKDLTLLRRKITTKKFKVYIAEKCMDELMKIQQRELSTIQNGISVEEIMLYISCNHYKIDNDKNTITIYNDATIDVSTKPMSERAKSTYEGMTLSLAKLIEYGMGYTGANFTPNPEQVEGWEYDIRERENGLKGYGYKGWYYYDEGGERYWTNGIAGRMIFYKLIKTVEAKIYDWISEYWVIEKSKSL